MTYQEALQARARIAYSKNALTKVAFKLNKKTGGTQAAPQDDAPEVKNYAEEKLGGNAGNPDKGNGVAAPTKEEELRAIIGERDKDLAALNQDYNNLRYGLGASGAGLAGGAGIGAATYGLTGLFPSLKKRRLLRALIALGAGGAGGTGLGYLTYRGLQNGTVQDWVGKAKAAGNDAINWGQKQVQTVKDKFSGSGKASEAESKPGDGK